MGYCEGGQEEAVTPLGEEDHQQEVRRKHGRCQQAGGEEDPQTVPFSFGACLVALFGLDPSLLEGEESPAEESVSVRARLISGDAVVLRTTMEMTKVVAAPVLHGGEFWYRVRFAYRVENVVEEDLEPLGDEYLSLEHLAQMGRWETLQAFRCALAVERIRNTNHTTV